MRNNGGGGNSSDTSIIKAVDAVPSAGDWAQAHAIEKMYGVYEKIILF